MKHLRSVLGGASIAVVLSACTLTPIESTYSVIYIGNGNTGGSVPLDPTRYAKGDTAVVLQNSGALVRAGCTFECWNSRSERGKGTPYYPGDTLVVGDADVVLYAQWIFPLRTNGPAGGWVFYDKGYYSGGWRYLEAAPSDGPVQPWYNGTNALTNATNSAVGTGRSNTTLIVALQGSGDYAAQWCDDLVVGSWDDWFLPSAEEFYYALSSLYSWGVGGIVNAGYWTSTEVAADTACAGLRDHLLSATKSVSLRVRAIRSF